jgi:predicted TPR repeat methyltransferase
MENEVNKHERMKTFFEDLWGKGDPWSFDTSRFEQLKYARKIELLGDKKFWRVLEIGCGAGAFTALLARQVDCITGTDISRWLGVGLVNRALLSF